MTQAGVTYADYLRRVGDTKAAVDRFTVSPPNNPARDALNGAMAYYLMATDGWGGSPSDRVLFGCAGRPEVETCAPLKAHIEQHYKEKAARLRSLSGQSAPRQVIVGAIVVDGTAPLFWSCAADKIAEAEKLLTPSR